MVLKSTLLNLHVKQRLWVVRVGFRIFYVKGSQTQDYAMNLKRSIVTLGKPADHMTGNIRHLWENLSETLPDVWLHVSHNFQVALPKKYKNALTHVGTYSTAAEITVTMVTVAMFLTAKKTA